MSIKNSPRRNLPHRKKDQGPRILIVEDQPSDIVGPYYLVNHLGYDVTLAFDGGQALTELRSKSFDFVILDWNMPFVSGGMFLRSLEKEGARKRRPTVNIILHSGELLEHDSVLDGSRYRVVDIWHKPMATVEILRRLKLLAERYGRAA